MIFQSGAWCSTQLLAHFADLKSNFGYLILHYYLSQADRQVRYEVINKFLAHFTFADVIRISEMRTLRIAYPLRYEKKFCEMATIPTCILRCFYSFISASIPLSNSSSIFLFSLPPKYMQFYTVLSFYLHFTVYEKDQFPEMYRMDYNTLRLNGRVVVVVIVPFSIHWLLYMCAFSYVSELFSWGKRAEKQDMCYLCIQDFFHPRTFPDSYTIGLGQLQKNGC